MYQIVLREARRPEDLAYLNGARLASLWPDLHLPRDIRQAWQEKHPELRAAQAGYLSMLMPPGGIHGSYDSTTGSKLRRRLVAEYD